MDNGFFDMINEIERTGLKVYGIEVEAKGELIFRKMFGEDKRYPVYSAAKSFTATAVGIAADEGRLTVGAPLAEYLDRRSITAVPEQLRGAFCSLPIERFLTMSISGYPFRPEGADWLESVLKIPANLSAPPSFAYTNICAYLVGVACENAVGGDLPAYLKPRLFDPLGICGPAFQLDPQGRFYGATGMYLTVNELSRLGKLYLQRGVYGGGRILSESWAAQATSKHIDNAEGGYGYFFWTSGDHFSISGKWGQKCLVYPEKELMITYLGDMPDDSGKMLALAEGLAEEF